LRGPLHGREGNGGGKAELNIRERRKGEEREWKGKEHPLLLASTPKIKILHKSMEPFAKFI